MRLSLSVFPLVLIACESPGSSGLDCADMPTAPICNPNTTDTVRPDAVLDATGTDATASMAETTPSPDIVTPGVSELTGVLTEVSVTTPTRNADCDDGAIDTGVYGAKYPWGGLAVDGLTFTCNKCPGGLPDLQGQFRAHGWDGDWGGTPDYDIGNSPAKGDAEVLFIDGNTWYSKLYFRSENRTEETRGYFFCSQRPEHANEHLFWVITEVVDDGGIGLDAGTVWRTEVISSGAERKVISWFADLSGEQNVQTGYCRIGTEFADKACNDPF